MSAITAKTDTKTEMIAVVAMAENRIIGDGTGLIWHLPEDLRRVKALTMGSPLIMGRKTWDSIGRPLPGRASIVLTRDPFWHADGAIAVTDLSAAIIAAKQWISATPGARNAIILFGGGQIYDMGLALCNRIELTLIAANPECGPTAALFPELDGTGSESLWHRVTEAKFMPTDTSPGYRYDNLTRKKPVFV